MRRHSVSQAKQSPGDATREVRSHPMKSALITGPSSGIGRITAMELGGRGFHIIAAGRSEERTRPVVEAIRAGGGSAEFLELDLASLTSVRSAAGQFNEGHRTLGVLINNAGVFRARRLTIDGFEPHFGINHMGHFLLTQAIGPSLEDRARIITISSALHQRVDGIDFDAVTRPRRTRSGLDEYAVSKLANILFSAELARRRPTVRAYSVHPGFSRTGIIPKWARPFLRSRLITPEAGAATTIWCATEPGLESETGHYYVREALAVPSAAARDDKLSKLLWEKSEEWCDTPPRSVSR